MAEVKTNVSVAVLNRLRDSASIDYRNAVPVATANADVIKSIGKIIIDSPNLQNEFSNYLINRIAKVLIERAIFEDPLAKVFDKGLIEYGDVIEEVFIDLCNPHTYSVSKGDTDVFKRAKNNIKSAFHVTNAYYYYKSSISPKMIRKAFLSVDGIEDLIRGLVGSMTTSYNVDNYLLTKYMLAKAMLDGTTCIKPVSAITTQATGNAFLEVAKEDSNNMEFPNRKYNTMSVANVTSKENQYLITSNAVDAKLSIETLAYMFSVAFGEVAAKKVRVDNFTFTDDELERIENCLAEKDENGNLIEGGDTDFEPFTDDELAALANIQAILLDGQFIQNYGQLFETRYIENPANLWENYWLHVWKMYSRSPFAQCICYASGTNGPQSVAIDSESLPTVKAGTAGNKTIDAEVTVSGLVPKGAQLVKWSVALSEGATGEATIDATGKLTWTDDFTAADTITVTCTSAIDDTVYDSEVITVGSAT